MGMVPNLVTGVWVGGENRSVHFKTIKYGQGGSMALPIWGLYMKKNYENEDLGISKGEFERPSGLSIEIDCSKLEEEPEEDDLPEDDLEDLDF